MPSGLQKRVAKCRSFGTGWSAKSVYPPLNLNPSVQQSTLRLSKEGSVFTASFINCGWAEIISMLLMQQIDACVTFKSRGKLSRSVRLLDELKQVVFPSKTKIV
jgi:hypothetical protein